jgi:hypothetical protein
MTDYTTSKFTNAICEQLYMMSMDGPDEQIGSVDDGDYISGGWYGLMLNTGISGAEFAILHNDSQGFITYVTFEDASMARTTWGKIEGDAMESYDYDDDNLAA